MSSCISCKNFSQNKKIKKINTQKILLNPPTKVDYEIIFNNEGEICKVGPCYKKIIFKHLIYENILYPWIETDCYSVMKSVKKTKIILLRIINNKIPIINKNTIIFSHGKSSDLGIEFPFLIDISTQLKVIII